MDRQQLDQEITEDNMTYQITTSYRHPPPYLIIRSDLVKAGGVHDETTMAAAVEVWMVATHFPISQGRGPETSADLCAFIPQLTPLGHQ